VLDQRRALKASDETYLRVAQTAEALFRLAGEKELARRLRPKARSKRQRPAIVRAAVGWWYSLVAVFHRLRGLAVQGVETARRWADFEKARVFRLARGFPNAPNV